MIEALAFGSILSAMKKPSASITASHRASVTSRACSTPPARATSLPR